jgi:hypothetical protein
MDDVAALRVDFRADQHLGARHLRSEQAYHIAMRRRHNIAQHEWGIVMGLELLADAVERGFAIDGYGRELILPQRTGLRVQQTFNELGGDVLDVWLLYGRQTDGDWFVESARVELTKGLDPWSDRRHPPRVPPEDVSFDATRVPPDEPSSLWPVYLGSIQRDPTDPTKPNHAITRGRPYVGVRAATIHAPGGPARIELGETFAVRLDDSSGAKPVIESDADGTTVSGQLVVIGDVAIGKGNLVFSRVQNAGSLPWRIQRKSGQLRIVMDDGSGSQVAVGVWKDGQFQSCLTVTNNGDVKVHGNLVVGGTVHATAVITP